MLLNVALFPFPASPITAAAAMAITAEFESDEWEVVNDDDFVYKCKKRHLDPSAIARLADPELEARQRWERKFATLLKVRDKYAKEISLWKHMANALRAMEQSARDKHVDDPDRAKTLGQDRIHQLEGESEANFVFDELLLQVEGQEAIIDHITNVCEVGEVLCDEHEEEVKQSWLDLPVWDSPLELIYSTVV